MKKLAVIASTILLAGLLTAWGQTQSQQPNPPDPTAHAPSSTAPATPPTFPTQSGSQAPEQTPSTQPPEKSGSTTSSPAASQGARTFVGQIIMNNNSYLLRSGDEEYKLDDQSKAKSFAGKDVKVTGDLDRQNKKIHVDSIEIAPSI